MRAADVFALASGALRAQRRRTGLSLLGVAIGTAAVLVMTALGEGARNFAGRQFASLGTNLLVVLPGHVETSGALPGVGGVPNDLTLDDALALQRAVPHVRRMAPLSLGTDALEHGALSRNVIVMGTTPQMLDIRGLALRTGAFLPDGPWDRGAPVVVLGAKIARELFPAAEPLGETVRLGGQRMRVIGVLRPRGTHLGVDLDEGVFVPVATCMRMFDRTSLFRVLIELDQRGELAAAQRAARATLIARHGEEDFTLITQDALIGAVGRIIGVLTLALAAIAAVSLVVAGVGIMNVMLVSVAERTREIGLCKALGATRAQVVELFLAESALIAVLGAALGLALGECAVRALAALQPQLAPSIPAWALAATAALALAVGVLFGVLPARRAMRLEATSALARR